MKIYTFKDGIIHASGYEYPFHFAYVLVRFLNAINELTISDVGDIKLKENKYQSIDYQRRYNTVTRVLNELILNQEAKKPVELQYGEYLLEDESVDDAIESYREEGYTFVDMDYLFDEQDPVFRNNHYLDNDLKISLNSTIIRLKEFYEFVFLLVNDYYIKKKQRYAFKIDISELGQVIEYSFKSITINYEVNSVEELILLFLSKMVNEDVDIKRCEYCGDYFIKNARNTEVYCLKIHENGRTCKDMGPDKKVQIDDALDLYRKTYKKYNQKWNKPSSITGQKKWKEWSREAKVKRETYKDGDISSEEFIEWLKERRD